MSIEGAGGQHIIITGASSGIGEAIARTLAQHGHRLVLAARRSERLEALAKEINPSGKRVVTVTCDVCNDEDLHRLLERARGVFGPINTLVNNAGVSGGVNPNRDWTKIETVLTTNFLAAIKLSEMVLPEMRQYNNGHIINIGSVAGRIAGSSAYSASKFGLRGYTLGLQRELQDTNVHASLVAPGFIRTDMTAFGPPLPMPGPEVVANAVLGLLEAPKREVIVPWWYAPLVALENLVPALGDRMVRSQRK